MPHHPSSVQPLPAELRPDFQAGNDARIPISGRHVFRSLAIGTMAGAVTGVVVGALTTSDCGETEQWCILPRDEEIAIAGFVGAMAGAAVGGVYGLLTSPRRPRTEPAPVAVLAAQDGGVGVGVTVRH